MKSIDRNGMERGICKECMVTDEPCSNYVSTEQGPCGYCGCPPTKHLRVGKIFLNLDIILLTNYNFTFALQYIFTEPSPKTSPLPSVNLWLRTGH